MFWHEEKVFDFGHQPCLTNNFNYDLVLHVVCLWLGLTGQQQIITTAIKTGRQYINVHYEQFETASSTKNVFLFVFRSFLSWKIFKILESHILKDVFVLLNVVKPYHFVTVSSNVKINNRLWLLAVCVCCLISYDVCVRCLKHLIKGFQIKINKKKEKHSISLWRIKLAST